MRDKINVNENISARIVTVIGADGQKLGDFLSSDAISLAKNDGLDLVQVSQDRDKPVCKIMDFGKWKYELSKKKKKSGSSNVKLKEIKMRVGIDTHDLNFKIAQARKFLDKGNRVKITVGAKGRRGASHLDLAKNQCLEVCSTLEDVSVIESELKNQGNSFFVILAKK